MSKPTKENVNYRYPDICCGRCKSARQSDYGDYYCLSLMAGTTIDLGGQCDLFELDAVIQTADLWGSDDIAPSIETEEVVQAKSCLTCIQYNNGICSVDNTTVVNTTEFCNAWELNTGLEEF